MSGDLQPVQVRQANIKQNQIRLQLFGFLDGFQPIRGLRDLKFRPLLQRRTDESAEGFKVIDYQYLKGLHHPCSPYQLDSPYASGVAFLKQAQFSFLNSKLRSTTSEANYDFRTYVDMGLIKIL